MIRSTFEQFARGRDRKPVQARSMTPEVPILSQSSEPTRTSKPARILVTDDRPEVLQLVDRVLGERYACDFATNVEQARQRLASKAFQLALCDIQMVGESGVALAEEIVREHPDIALVPFTGEDSPRGG
jgi:response regulator RpfG family c-di-GMP phosphodiesterase